MIKKKNIISFILFGLLALGTFLLPSVFLVRGQENFIVSENSTNNVIHASGAVATNYYLQDYDVQMDVRLDNSIKITEKISAVFYSGGKVSTGIDRYIPYILNVTALNENNKYEDKKYRAQIEVLNGYTILKDGSHYPADWWDEYEYERIYLDSPSAVNGTTQYYVMEYIYKIGYDRIEEYDQLYFNILGDRWDTKIENFTYKITMPKEFTNTPVLMSGGYGYEGNKAGVTYEVNGLEITGKNTVKFLAYEGVTIQLRLPENYFNEVTKFNYTQDTILIIISVCLGVIFVAIGILCWNKHNVVKPVELYAPNKMDPAKLSCLLNGKSTPNSVTSLIMYWANLGYLKIINVSEDMSLEKCKNLPDDATEYEKIVFNAIFKNVSTLTEGETEDEEDKGVFAQIKEEFAKSVKNVKTQQPTTTDNSSDAVVDKTKGKKKKEPKTSVKLSSLEGKIGSKIYAACKLINDGNGQRLDKTSIVYFVMFALAAIIPFMAFLIIYHTRYGFIPNPLLIIVGIVSTVIGLICLVRSVPDLFGNTNKKRTINLIIGTGLLVAVILTCMFTLTDGVIDKLGLRYYIGFISIIGLIVSARQIHLNNETKEIYGRILGFKNKIILSDKNEMKLLLKENPNYYFDVLPYAYVMGVTDEFAEKFEGLAINSPDWYVSSSPSLFNVIIFNHAINHSFKSFSKGVMIQHNKSLAGKSGGFSGGGFGGGFSGGGFGGGGGGSH